jgi:uncharacterized protein with von Willebrand factor type A (vWA) domain
VEAFGPPRPQLSKSVIVHDPFDKEAFEEILPRATGIRLLLRTSEVRFSEELAFDLFCSFYKYFDRLRSIDEIAPECQGHRDLLERAIGLREHAKLRGFTRLKPAEAALATELVLASLLEELARLRAEPPNEPNEGNLGRGESPPSDRGEQASTERVREALQDARENLQTVTELIAAWSSGPGQETRLPTALKFRLMREVARNPRLKTIARLFGRYRRLALRERNLPAQRSSEEFVDFVRGGDVARALAAELSNLAMEEREDLFYQKVATRTLLIYELGRRIEVPRHVYVCVDISGSMGGEREVWAKATALALANLALAQGRPVQVVLFGDAQDSLKFVRVSFEDDSSTRLEKFLDVASCFLGGGTDFVKPLSSVLDSIQAETGHGNDLLFVSDGLCPIPKEFVRRFREAKDLYDLRMTSVVIGNQPFGLTEISDSVYRLDEAMDAGEAIVAHSASAFLERRPERGIFNPSAAQHQRGVPRLYERFVPSPD